MRSAFAVSFFACTCGYVAGCTAQQLASVQAAPVALDPLARALDALVPGAGSVLTAAGIVAAAAASFLAHRKASTAHARISKHKRDVPPIMVPGAVALPEPFIGRPGDGKSTT